MSMMKEFKDFAIQGNVVDIAVGIIVCAAFGNIVSSFVGDVVMPPIGLLLGGVDFADLVLTLKAATDGDPAVVIRYGKFIQTVIDFLVIAFAIFMAIRAMNSLKRRDEVADTPGEPPAALRIPSRRAGARRSFTIRERTRLPPLPGIPWRKGAVSPEYACEAGRH